MTRSCLRPAGSGGRALLEQKENVMEHQFDELAKALAEGMSRREALRRVGGGLAAVLLVSLGWSREAWGDTRAVCKSVCGGLGKYGNQCMSVCMSCSSASCVTGSPGAKTCLQCTGGKVCSSGSCVCPSGQTDCSGTCVNTATDPSNCGGCTSSSASYVCRTDQVCSINGCQCPTGQTECSGTCVDTATDRNNCGICGTVCGACCSGTCVDTATDSNNCGACGNVCERGGACQGGSCLTCLQVCDIKYPCCANSYCWPIYKDSWNACFNSTCASIIDVNAKRACADQCSETSGYNACIQNWGNEYNNCKAACA
jgi:Stigma-specific protein, Stig1